MGTMKTQKYNSGVTIRKRAISLILALVLFALILPTGSFAASEQTYTLGDWQYQLHGPTVIITGYTGQGGAVTIPGAIESMPVLYIGSRVFQDRTGLTSVTIPNGVAGILENAFAGCTGLRSVTIPSSVTWISERAFADCILLYDIYFSSATPPTTVGNAAFSNISSGARAIVPNGAAEYGSEGSLWNGLVVTSLQNAAHISVTNIAGLPT